MEESRIFLYRAPVAPLLRREQPGRLSGCWSVSGTEIVDDMGGDLPLRSTVVIIRSLRNCFRECKIADELGDTQPNFAATLQKKSPTRSPPRDSVRQLEDEELR